MEKQVVTPHEINVALTASRPPVDHADLMAAGAELATIFELHDPEMDIECWEAVWRIADMLYPERTPLCRKDGQYHPCPR